LTPKEVTLTVQAIHQGQCLPLQTLSCTAKAACAQKVLTLPLSVLPKNAILVCDCESGQQTDRAFYREGTLPMVPCESVCVEARTQDSITVSAQEYVHAVELEGEYVFTDNYFSLLPGQTRTVFFRPARNAQSRQITVTGYTVKT